MNNDQIRVRDALAPLVLGASPEDATVLNRCFLEGADPLFIMRMLGAEFDVICKKIDVDPQKAKEGIETAHTQGPGVFLKETAVGFGIVYVPRKKGFRVKWKMEDTRANEYGPEIIWLILAGCSRIEGGFTKETSLEDRLREAFECVSKASAFADRCMDDYYEAGYDDLHNFAAATLLEFQERTLFKELDLGNGTSVPLGESNEAFYIGYKRGYPAVAVSAKDATFFGTSPNTTLKEQGIRVDKEVSPHFGIRFKE